MCAMTTLKELNKGWDTRKAIKKSGISKINSGTNSGGPRRRSTAKSWLLRVLDLYVKQLFLKEELTGNFFSKLEKLQWY
jgi:hypothetical protein